MKCLTKEEMVDWIKDSEKPFKLSATELTPDMIMLRRVTKGNENLTPHQEIMLRKILTEN